MKKHPFTIMAMFAALITLIATVQARIGEKMQANGSYDFMVKNKKNWRSRKGRQADAQERALRSYPERLTELSRLQQECAKTNKAGHSLVTATCKSF